MACTPSSRQSASHGASRVAAAPAQAERGDRPGQMEGRSMPSKGSKGRAGCDRPVINSGPVTITFNDDGTLTIVQRGQNVSGDQGVLTGSPFLIHESGRLVTVAQPNQSGLLDFISQE